MSEAARAPDKRILLLGATGTIGRATASALVRRGHEVVCFARAPAAGERREKLAGSFPGALVRFGDVADPSSLVREAIRGEKFDAVVSCLASRTGAPRDAWAVDHDAQVNALETAKAAGVPHFVLLSAICVQKPLLEFQRAKLAFEKKLIESGLDWSIVRPTAFFKSLSGQIERVRQGKAFLLFGDGTRTACKPISDDDLADYIAGCLSDDARRNRVLPIGGPGPAITPRQQGERLFELFGKPAKFRSVPVGMFDAIAGVLGALGRIAPPLAEKAEFARIARYYATESMLLLDPATGRYDADATPSTGSQTLFGFYGKLVRGEATVDRGEHAMF
ncbi:MAG: NAD(P)H-binding protein [Beijerinckiaceae bacterium]